MINNYPENMNMDELMLNKSFSQLNEEEKNFVLQMLDSENEYEEMRNMLIDIKQSLAEEEEIVPDEKIKNSLMQAFQAKHGNDKKIIYLIRSKNLLRSPVFQIAAVGLIIIGIGILLFNTSVFNEKNGLAINTTDKLINTEESVLPSASLKKDSLELNNKVFGTKLPAGEEEKAIKADDTKKDVVLELNDEKNFVAGTENDKLVLNNNSDDEVVTNKKFQAAEPTKQEERLRDNEKQKRDTYSGVVVNDTVHSITKSANSAPVSTGRAYNETLVTDNSNKAERKESNKQSMHKSRIAQEKNSNSISLAEKPELMEFLFTAL